MSLWKRSLNHIHSYFIAEDPVAADSADVVHVKMQPNVGTLQFSGV